eukprot:GDKJ01042143.1.p1 GENE.GDKJ01042143.1~~GDKJ01042143.1.p1  ORF type:complete len:570 (-),score=104.11 GDKJ01042143.1:52-1761(-)
MDLLAFHSEKQAVVIDFGQVRTKLGFTNEATPRYILKSTELARFDIDGNPIIHSLKEWIKRSELFLRKAIYHYLQTSLKDRKVVLVDDPLLPTNFRKAIIHVLFSQFQTPAIVFVPALVAPLYTTGLHTGLVIDVGYSDTRAMATYSGVSLIQSLSFSKRGALSVDRRLETALTERTSAILPSDQLQVLRESHIEDIKVRGCYCRADVSGAPLISKVSPAYVSGGLAFNIPPSLRWGAFESLFCDESKVSNLDLDKSEETDFNLWWNDESSLIFKEGSVGGGDISLGDLVIQLLLKIPIECQSGVMQNIVVVGGTCDTRGFIRRMALELQQKLAENPKLKHLSDKFAFALPPCIASLRSWQGGALMGGLEGVESKMTIQQWKANEIAPDTFDPFARIGSTPLGLSSFSKAKLKKLNVGAIFADDDRSDLTDLPPAPSTVRVQIPSSAILFPSSAANVNPSNQVMSPTNPFGPYADRTASSAIGTASILYPYCKKEKGFFGSNRPTLGSSNANRKTGGGSIIGGSAGSSGGNYTFTASGTSAVGGTGGLTGLRGNDLLKMTASDLKSRRK